MKNRKSVLMAWSFWTISGLLIWIAVFLWSFFGTGNSLSDSFVIPSVVLLAILSLLSLFRWGFLEKLFWRMQNSRHATNAATGKVKEPITLVQYQKERQQKSWLPIIVNMVVYLFFLILGVVV